ncbi:MAG: ABC transporter ATP-binding protein [Bryobacterales bacterium]|nr:ABC transporter ATP-binding protein [Bryobacterales bacterium]
MGSSWSKERVLPKDLLQVENLTIEYRTGKLRQTVLQQITFKIREAEVVGVLGESGSGKTTLALALMGVLSSSARIVQGTVRLGESDLLALSEQELQKIRGAKISMIFQEPEMTLNPVMRTIDHVAEVIKAHRNLRLRHCRAEARQILAQVQFNPTGRLLSAYPHQLSGGQRQRLVIAQALACRPQLLVADEPTASLDSTLQVQWLSLMKDLRARLGLAMLLITHDPAILRGLADRIFVMYKGRIVEETTFEQLMQSPLHPYTQGLLRSMAPSPKHVGEDGKHLVTIPGSAMKEQTTGCPFEPRCADRMAECSVREPPNIKIEHGRRVRCLRYVR